MMCICAVASQDSHKKICFGGQSPHSTTHSLQLQYLGALGGGQLSQHYVTRVLCSQPWTIKILLANLLDWALPSLGDL